MKKSLFLLFFIVKSLSAYDSIDYNNLINGVKDLAGTDLTNINIKNLNLDDINFSNANLSGSYFEDCSLNNADLNNSNLSNSKFIDCNLLSKNISKISNAQNLILVRAIIDDANNIILMDKGAFIPNKSIVCNSDLHVFGDNLQETSKVKHISKMIEAANNSKNNVKAIILAGDMCEFGDQKDWDKFITIYYNPLKNTGKPVLMTAGNHDRWQREDTLAEKLNMWTRTALGLGSTAIEEVKDLYDGKIYYKRYVDAGMDIVSLGECPTMTNKYNKGAISWYQNLSHKYPEIIFYHYSPLKMRDWWTTGDNPRPTSLSRGDKALNSFNNSITSYKDRIALMITGHHHSTFFEYWQGIPAVNVGGEDRFALCHFYINRDLRINKCIAIELIHYDSATAPVFHYPCLGDQELREARTILLTHFYRIYLDRDPDPVGLQNYLNNWYSRGEEKGIKERLKNSQEGRTFTIKQLYLKYLNREADSGGLSYYLENWDEFGGSEKIALRLQNSKEGRSICLRKLYLEYLNREPDESGFNYYLTNWDKFGGKLGIESTFIKSPEARMQIVTDIYLTYLEREPSQEEFEYYLTNWIEIGGKVGIEEDLKLLNEVRVIIIKNLYLKWLEREVDQDGLNHYLSLWDSIGGDVEIEHRLKNSIEGRPIALRILCIRYLERQFNDSDFNYYLENWVEFGYYNGIEQRISNSIEAKKIIINNLFQEYLGRDATNDEKNYYLDAWSSIGGKEGVAEELQTFYI